MRNKHVTRFGNPTTPTGALYFVSDHEGLLLMAVELELAKLYQEGVILTPSYQARITDRIRRQQIMYQNKIANRGVPSKLKTLFQIDKKSEAEKYCKSLSLSELELFLLIHNCAQINFKHQSKFPEYIPSHLNITHEDTEKLKEGNVRSLTKKIVPLLSERRRIHVHLFQRNAEWHCFYFSYDDIDPNDENHWINGCHLHYVSYLWPNHSSEHIWNAFDKRFTKIAGKTHVRFSPYEYLQLGETRKNDLSDQFKKPPWAFDFDSDFASGYSSEPSPTAQITTRGFWTATISTRAERDGR